MRWLICAVLIFATGSSFAAPNNQEYLKTLYGTWKFGSVDNKRPDKTGFMNMSPGGRIIILVTSNDRPKPLPGAITSDDEARLYKSIISFAGTYSVQKNEFGYIHSITVSIDAAADPKLVGTEQKFFVKAHGDKKLAMGTSGGELSFYWEKVTDNN